MKLVSIGNMQCLMHMMTAVHARLTTYRMPTSSYRSHGFCCGSSTMHERMSSCSAKDDTGKEAIASEQHQLNIRLIIFVHKAGQ